MKAPDKIYISHLCDTTIDGEEGHLMAMSFEDNGGEKYIRKDVLLEWLREVRAIPHENAITRDLAFQEVVNKLNSM